MILVSIRLLYEPIGLNNMEIFKKHKKLFIILIVVIIGFIVYSFFFTGSSDDDAPLVSESAAASDASGGELLVLLNTLKGIDLDTGIFEDTTFRSLIDFSVEINPEPVGRDNPFAPIGVGNVVVPTDG